MTKKNKTIDPCVHCGLSTAFGSGRFVNRIPSDSPTGEILDGAFACALCAGFECDECNQQISVDEEVRVENNDGSSNYHKSCHCESKHGKETK